MARVRRERAVSHVGKYSPAGPTNQPRGCLGQAMLGVRQKDYSNPCTRQKEESGSHRQLLIQAHWEPVLHHCAVTSFLKGQGKLQAVTFSSFTKGRKRESTHHPCSQFLSGHIHREDHALRDKSPAIALTCQPSSHKTLLMKLSLTSN